MFTQTNVQSVTLQTAILMEVKEFSLTNTPFSVHDITQNIRRKTMDGTLEIPEVEVVGASIRFNIPHANVKSIFDEMWRNGTFDPFLTLSRNFTGKYFRYAPTPVSTQSSQTSTQPTQQSIPQVPCTFAPASTTVQNNTDNIVKADKNTVTQRIKQYLEYCKSAYVTPTMKKIQSSIKCNGWTCRDISYIVSNDLNKTVVRHGYISKSSVIGL